MLGVLVTDFTAEKVDVATQTSKELQVNIKDSKYVFDIGEEVKVIVNNKLYSGVVTKVMTVMIFITIKSEKEVPDIVGKTVSYKDKSGVVIDINDFSIIADEDAPYLPDDKSFEPDTDYLTIESTQAYGESGLVITVYDDVSDSEIQSGVEAVLDSYSNKEMFYLGDTDVFDKAVEQFSYLGDKVKVSYISKDKKSTDNEAPADTKVTKTYIIKIYDLLESMIQMAALNHWY